MSLLAVQLETLDRLLFALRDDELTQPQAAELERFVLGDAEAMHHYLRVASLNVGLRWMAESGEAEVVDDSSRGNQIAACDGSAMHHPSLVAHPSASPVPSPGSLIPPIVINLSPSSQYSLPPTPFVGGWLFSRLAATAMTAVAVLGAWAHKVGCETLASITLDTPRKWIVFGGPALELAPAAAELIAEQAKQVKP